MRFKKGQKVVCVDDKWYSDSEYVDRQPAPKYNELCVVSHYCGSVVENGPSKGFYLIHLEGYRCCFSEDGFKPLIEDSVLEKELEGISEHITI